MTTTQTNKGRITKPRSRKASSTSASAAVATKEAIDLDKFGPIADFIQSAVGELSDKFDSGMVSVEEKIQTAVESLRPKNPLTGLRRRVDDSTMGGYFTNGALILMAGAAGWFIGEKVYDAATSTDG